MRSIRYGMILKGPYHITNIPGGCNTHPISMEDRAKMPGIRMIVEDCEDLEKFYASFEYVQIDNARPKFERQLPQVLRSREAAWKLAEVDISNHELCLGFLNGILLSKYHDRCRTIKDCHGWGFVPPFYSESALSWKPGVGAKLRFEVDNPADSSMSITFVTFYEDGRFSVVTEFDGDKKRCFRFTPGEGPDSYPVEVEEWMW